MPCFEKESSISNMLARKHDRKPEEILKFASCQEVTCTLILSMFYVGMYFQKMFILDRNTEPRGQVGHILADQFTVVKL